MLQKRDEIFVQCVLHFKYVGRIRVVVILDQLMLLLKTKNKVMENKLGIRE